VWGVNRRAPAFVLLVALFAVARVVHPAGRQAGGLQAFVGARLIDGTGREPVDNAVLVVANGRVEAVGPADRVRIPAGAARVDLSTRTIVPG
jgi:imidazolonepropionase-like amidohydrolase